MAKLAFPVDAALRARDFGAIESLAADGQTATFALEVTTDYEVDAEELEELVQAEELSHAEALKRARLLINITLSGSSHAINGHFAEAVWQTLGAICGGLLDDPQTGKAEWVEPE